MNTSQSALRDSPTVLIATLISARRSGDRVLARIVSKRLREIGVRIVIQPAPAGRKGVQDAR